jgi:hypothetical protein
MDLNSRITIYLHKIFWHHLRFLYDITIKQACFFFFFFFLSHLETMLTAFGIFYEEMFICSKICLGYGEYYLYQHFRYRFQTNLSVSNT